MTCDTANKLAAADGSPMPAVHVIAQRRPLARGRPLSSVVSRRKMIDKRLLGTWKSDTRRTMREIRNLRDVTPAEANGLRKFFGKLSVRYTRGKVYQQLSGATSVSAYRVAAKNGDGVVIVIDSALGVSALDSIVHVHFDGRYYWVCLGKYREYFKRIE